MRESRHPYAPVRSIISKQALRDACRPRSHKPLTPGKESASTIPGLSGLQVIEVVSDNND